MPQFAYPLLAFLFGGAAAWAMTVPLHRFKEFRPKSPRDIEAEVASAGKPAQVVFAAYRHALCPTCHHEYSTGDVAPVVSWFRGCPGCGERLPVTVPLLQAGLAAACAITAVTLDALVGNLAVVVPFLWLAVVFAAIAVIDFRIWLIPYWMPWAGTLGGMGLITIVSLAVGKPLAILYAIGGGVGLFVLFFLLWLFGPSKLGFSDVRLAALIGVFLGWLDPRLPIYGLLFGSIMALAIGLISIASRKGNRFAFGPALALGAMCAVWFAGPILH